MVALGPVPVPTIAEALASGDPAALFAIDREYAPFWCPRCAVCHCGEHYRTQVRRDEGFFDCLQGLCPAGHERMLVD